MKEIENIKNLPFFTYLLFLITSLSFFLQPLIIRPYGIPVSFSLIIILNLLMIINLKNLNLKEIIYLTFISSFLLIVDIITPPGEYRGFIFVNMILFTFLSSKFSLNEKQSKTLWSSVLIIGLTLALIGLKRWLTGYSVESSENETGISENIKTYFYLGISYLNSTRNSDAFYFGIPLILGLSFYKDKFLKYRLLFLVVVVITSFCVLASLSRGVLISIIIPYILVTKAYRIKKAYKYLAYLVFCIVLIYLFADQIKQIPGLEYVYELTSNSFISIFDPNLASDNLEGKYTYSNAARMELYGQAINIFLEFPFGLGIDNIPPGKLGNDQYLLHFENAYLDYIVSLGIFSIPFFIFIFNKFKSLYYLSSFHYESKKLYFLFLYIIFYSLFNSATDLYYYWFIISLILMEHNSYIGLKRN